MYQVGMEKNRRFSCYILNFFLELLVFDFGFLIRKSSKNQIKHLLMSNQNKSMRCGRSLGTLPPAN